MENFGERLRELRKERGLTSYELATRLGISRNTLTNWERGEKEPHAVEILEEMAKILQVPLKSLLKDNTTVDSAENLLIKNLDERVTRLEQLFKKYMK